MNNSASGTNVDSTQRPAEGAVELGEARDCGDGYQETQNATTKFLDDGCVEELQVKPTKYEPVNVGEDEFPDILRFLEKPVIINSGTISTSTAVGNVANLPLPNYLFNNNVYSDKLTGVFGWRGSIKITLQVNTTRFQQGLIRLCRWSMPNYNSQRLTEQSQQPTLWTQMPGVELDIGTQTEVSMIIPWAYHMQYYMIHSPTTAVDNFSQIPFASVQLFLYSPLFSPSGDSNFDYVIYASCVDSELLHAAPGSAYYAANGIEMNGLIDDELPSKSVKKISQGFSGLRKVPLIGPLMETTAWATDALSGALRSVGLSAPQNLAPVAPMYPSMHAYTNSDDPSQSVGMGVFRDARTKMPKGVAPTEYDEMSIQHVVSKYAYVQTFNWADTATVNTNLGTIQNEPINQCVTYTRNSASMCAYSPIGYLARLFKYWRGGIKVRIRIVATEFHTGRLSLMYVPGTWTPTASPNYLTDGPFLQRTILDISTSRVIEFTMPFTNPTA